MMEIPEDDVIISCPECETKYRYDERRFDGEAVKRVKCTSCGFTFEAANPALKPAEAASGDVDGVVEAAADRGPELRADPAPPTAPVPPPADAAPVPAEDLPLPSLPADPRYSLAVIAGGQAGSVFQIHKSRLLIGRGSAMDIQLRDSEVSRRHAMLEIRDPDVVLTDLDATNGTWFNGVRITTAKLDHQDEFTLGSTTLMLIVTPVRGTR
jgi:predicted Zn finger-like uncharacterized protein